MSVSKNDEVSRQILRVQMLRQSLTETQFQFREGELQVFSVFNQFYSSVIDSEIP